MTFNTVVGQKDKGRRFAQSYEAAGSPLGPRQSWPAALRVLVDLILRSDQPTLIAWGDDLIALYNDAHAAMIGDRHPSTFGRPLFELWSGVSDLVEFRFRDALNGRYSQADRIMIPIMRDDRNVPAYFDISYNPIEDGDVIRGVLCISREITANVLSEQRQAALLELSDRLRDVDDPREIVATAVEVLGRSLRANRVGYGEVRPDEDTILLESSYVDGVAPLHGVFRLNSFGTDTIAANRRGETFARDDVHLSAEPGDEMSTWNDIQTRAFASAPLIRDGRFRASIFVNFRVPHAWSQAEIMLLEEIGARIWDSLERVRAEEGLRSSEARFRAAVAAVQGVLWTNNAEGEMAGEQAGWAALTGQTLREYEGYGWAAAVHPDDAEPTVAAWRAAVEAREPFLFEHRVRRRDGVWRTFSIRAIPIIEAGNVREWVGVHTDITEQRRAEEELRRSNAALRERIEEERAMNERLKTQGEALRRAQLSLSAIFGASSEGLTLCRLVTDDAGRGIDYQVLDVNPAHHVLTGIARDRMLVKPVSQIAPPIDPRWISTAERAVRTGKPQTVEVRSAVTGRWLDIHVSPVGGDLFAQTFIDVTARHEAEDQRRRLIEEMNHRVMNNFQMVAGVLELQVRRSKSAEVKDALQSAVRRVQSLSELHQNLATSPDSGEVEMRAYLTAICDKLRATIDDPARIVLAVSACEARLDLRVAVPLGFVVNELVVNAIKYAFPDPARGQIGVRFTQDEAGGHELLIGDDGTGLPEVVENKGSGLGTRLVRAFVAQIGGVLSVEQGPGVTFRISIPAHPETANRSGSGGDR